MKELGAELTVELIIQRGSCCDKHAGKQLELHCFDCKVNVCVKCFAVEHTQHKCREVEKVAEDIVKSAETNLEHVSSRLSQFRASATRADAEESQLIRAVQDVETTVKQRGEMLKRVIDKQVDHLLEQVQTFKETSQKEVESRKERLGFGIIALESFAAYSQELMSRGSPCDITRAADDLLARADELLQTYVTPVDHCAPGVKFVPTNTDEFTEPHAEQNIIGSVLTSEDGGKLQ